MKKLLLILLYLPLVFASCIKIECNCGDIKDKGTEVIEMTGALNEHLRYLVVENECTKNRDTLFVSEEIYYYYQDKKHYCTGAW